MGVVYKIQDDIKDFILAQKKSFPQISCRRLSDVVFEKFNIVVSKSSISSVIKFANLSSPIGRHSISLDVPGPAAKKTTKKFKIPSEKKDQIFVSANSQALDSQDILLPSKLPGQQEDFQEKNAPSEMKNPAVFIADAGVIFLKAIEWKLSGGSILGKILKEELGDRLNGDLERIGDEVLFTTLFDNNDKQQVDVPKRTAEILKAINDINDFSMKLAIEIQVLLQTSAYFQLIDEFSNKINVRLENRNVHSENVQSYGEIFFVQAMRLIDTEIIRNVHSAVFYCPTECNDIFKVVEVLKGLFKSDKKSSIREVLIYDSKNVQSYKYQYVPDKPRTFILAVPSWDKIFPQWQELWAKSNNVGSLKILDKNFVYKRFDTQDILTEHQNEKGIFLQALAVSDASAKQPFMVFFTNASVNPEATSKAVIDFLLTSPWFGQEDNVSGPLKQAPNFFAGSEISLAQLDRAKSASESIKALQNIVKTICRRSFFASNDPYSVENMKAEEAIYRLPGLWAEEQRACCLTLSISKNDPCFLALQQAAQRFNSAIVLDPRGRRFILKISSPAAF